MRKKVEKKSAQKGISKKTKREFELMGGTTIAVSAALVISIFLMSSLDSILIRSQQYASVLAAVLVDMANTDRKDNRLDGLKVNPKLVAAAQMKANDMAAKSYFAHTSPQGIDPWHWFEESDYKFAYAGENLAIDFSDSAAVNSAWMNSASHRANILDQHFTEIGIATASGFYQGHPTTFVVQEFGTPLSSVKKSTASAPVKTTVPKNPTTPAVATRGTTTQVLGESTVDQNADDSQTVSGPSMTVSYASPVSHAVASPSRTLKYAYYGLAGAILVLLAFATGFEIHVRHIKKAAAAGALLALMAVLFIVGNSFVFKAPVVPDEAGMAAAASAL